MQEAGSISMFRRLDVLKDNKRSRSSHPLRSSALWPVQVEEAQQKNRQAGSRYSPVEMSRNIEQEPQVRDSTMQTGTVQPQERLGFWAWLVTLGYWKTIRKTLQRFNEQTRQLLLGQSK